VEALIDLLDCFKGKIPEVQKKDAFAQLFKRFLSNLAHWVHTAKVYMIFHSALQDRLILQDIASELKAKEALLYCFAISPEETDLGKPSAKLP
jgi:hypothetical protein